MTSSYNKLKLSFWDSSISGTEACAPLTAVWLSTIPIVGPFRTWLLTPLAAALLCSAGLLAPEETHAVSSQVSGWERAPPTPPPTAACARRGWKLAPNPTDLSADWKAPVGGGSCVRAGAWKAARL